MTRQKAGGAGLDELFNTVKAFIGAQLGGVEWIAITTDGWSGKRVSLWSVTASGIDKDWKRVHFKLGCIPVVASTHSSEVLSDKIKDLLAQFRVPDEKVCAVTTDEGGAAPCIAERFWKALEIHCGVHLLNTAQKKAVEQLNQKYPASALFFSTVHEMAKHFNLPQAADQLVANQLATGEPLHVIQRHVVTRFNTWLAPLRTVQSSKEAINRYALSNPEAPFSDVLLQHPLEFWQFVNSMIKLLTPFEKATLTLSAEDATLDSLIAAYLILVKELCLARTALNGLQDELTHPIREMAYACVAELLTQLETKFEPVTSGELIAFALNPFHKPLNGSDNWHRKWNETVELARHELKEAWKKYIDESPVDQAEADLIDDSAMYGVDFVTSSVPSLDTSTTDLANDELQQFFNARVTTANAMNWWRAHKDVFPRLAVFARKYLSPKCSQIDSERDFSGIRLILTDLRNRLSTTKVHKLSVVRPFLHRLYEAKPTSRSEANRAADARRVETAASTRRERLRAEYAAIPPNPAIPANAAMVMQHPENLPHELDSRYPTDIGDGERGSDEDFELDEATEEDFRNFERQDYEPHIPVIAPARASTRSGPTCKLFPVGKGSHQYIARFQNLQNREPPSKSALFGARSSLVLDMCRSSYTSGCSHYVITVTAEAKANYTSSKQLMRHLGETISITDEMCDN